MDDLGVPLFLETPIWIIKNHQTIQTSTKNHQIATFVLLIFAQKVPKPIDPMLRTSNMCRKAKSMRIKFCWNHASSYSPQLAEPTNDMNNDRNSATQTIQLRTRGRILDPFNPLKSSARGSFNPNSGNI